MTTVVGSHLQVFEHMLRHYRDIGIESLLINIHLETYDSSFYSKVQTITRRYRAEIISVFVGKWLQSVNPYLYRHTLQQSPEDWFLLADTDELQVYPGPVETLINTIQSEGYDFVEGFVIDRITNDGRFPPVIDTECLWSQFPLAGLVTYPLLRANSLKVVAARGRVRLSGGQHYAYNGRGCPRSLYYIPVHHFKWTHGLMERLKERIAFYNSIGDGLGRESERLLAHCTMHGGKLDVREPAFKLQESHITCPHEGELRAFVLAHEKEMPRP